MTGLPARVRILHKLSPDDPGPPSGRTYHRSFPSKHIPTAGGFKSPPARIISDFVFVIRPLSFVKTTWDE